jgi:hypothetical protein
MNRKLLFMSAALPAAALVALACGCCGDSRSPGDTAADEINPPATQAENHLPQITVVEIKDGDTPASLAAKYYGSEQYADLILHFNHLDEPENLEAGQVIRIPEFEALFSGESLAEVFSDELALILEVRSSCLEMENRLLERSRGGDDASVDLRDELVGRLREAAEQVDAAYEGFSVLKLGVVYRPRGLLSQLGMLSQDLRAADQEISEDSTEYFDRIHHRIAVALTYGVVWSRHGFS